MTRRIIECIPNFSEGRHTEVIDAIENAIVEVPGILLLDRHIDADHNRSVVTFAGSPEVVAQAAFSSIKVAAELIDLDHHQGEHPRIGATDVVPFVPISGVTIAECVAIAHALGERVGDELGIPVYLYEKAATRPDRVNLENIRRGEYEGLKETIGVDPDKTPDYGPNYLGTAGATVIGARHPLIAFNVYLSTDDVSIAKKIARAIRQSSGGLPFVKALGMLVEGRAQVSMNLTDFTQTPVFRVVEAIRDEATRHGVTIHHSELVGLIPQSALVDSAQWYLQLDQFEHDQVLETRLYDAIADEPSFLEQLAAGTPTPGGGAAAAYAGAMAAALVAMV
ncbi:MAG: glutamate formimidoyltransferase, partial [Anaerolineales bacterium]|nr:glutamate formimidoyltransferase [Anaerolineales bacterium]